MAQTPPPSPHRSQREIEPVSLGQLALLALGAFLVLFLVLEAFDPRWIASFRGPPPAATTPVALPSPIALRPLPRPAGANGALEADQSAGPGEPAGAGPKLAVVAPDGEGAALRDEPRAGAQVLARMQEGAGVELTGQEREVEGTRWVEIRTGDWIGWLEADLLLPAEPAR
jgi:hypothetical protein